MLSSPTRVPPRSTPPLNYGVSVDFGKMATKQQPLSSFVTPVEMPVAVLALGAAMSEQTEVPATGMLAGLSNSALSFPKCPACQPLPVVSSVGHNLVIC